MLKSILSLLKNKYFIILVGFTFLFPYIYKNAPIRVDITQDISLDKSIWLTKDDFDEKYEYVLFKPNKKEFPFKTNEDIKLLKKIFCKGGERLIINKNGPASCNDKRFSFFYKNSKSSYLKPFFYDGIVPKDKLFVIGTHAKSYDSRYFGFINKDQVLRSAIPIF